jgi:hypothetical protein
MRKLLILFLLTGCGFLTPKTKTEFLGQPTAKALEVGDKWRYVYVPERSSKAILDAEVTLTITEVSEWYIILDIVGEAKTKLGVLPIKSRQEIPKNILHLGTLALLRQGTRFILPGAVLEWLQLTPEGCDLIKAYSIKGADGVEIIGKLCAQTALVPELEANIPDLGLRVTLLLVQ